MPLFMKKYPNITVKHEGFTGEDYLKKITVLLAGNSIGDAFWTSVGTGTIYFFAAQKALRAVDELVSQEKFDLGQYYPGCVNAMKREGKLWGLPFKSHPGIAFLYYNQSLFESKGAAIPTKDWTLDQLLENARKVTANDTFGYFFFMRPISRTILSLTRAFGGELLDAEGKRSQLNSPEAIQAVTWLYEAMHKHKVTPTPAQLEAMGGEAKGFAAGKLGALRHGSAFQITGQNEVKDSFKWFVSVHPKGPKGVGGSDYEADAYSIASASKKSDAAWQWVKWLTNQESGIRLGEIGGTTGGRPDVFKSERLLKFPERKVFLEAMEGAMPNRPTANTRATEYEAVLQDAIAPVWEGKETPSKSFLDNVTMQVQAILDKSLP
jgi:multiple sugar transport system substrate-binding protein